jgi:hypothetical protein
MAKVKHIQLEKAIFIPGYGELKGRTLNDTHYPGIVFEKTTSGIEVTINRSGVLTTFMLPYAQVEALVYETPDVKKA